MPRTLRSAVVALALAGGYAAIHHLGATSGSTPAERARLYNEDGVHMYQQGDYAQARESFRAALQLTPEDVGLIYNIAETYERQGALAEAERHYYECLDRSPNHVVCRHTLASLLVPSGGAKEVAGFDSAAWFGSAAVTD